MFRRCFGSCFFFCLISSGDEKTWGREIGRVRGILSEISDILRLWIWFTYGVWTSVVDSIDNKKGSAPRHVYTIWLNKPEKRAEGERFNWSTTGNFLGFLPNECTPSTHQNNIADCSKHPNSGSQSFSVPWLQYHLFLWTWHWYWSIGPLRNCLDR